MSRPHEEDILDVAVTHLANDDYNHVPESELRELLALLRGTHMETKLWELADAFILEVRDALGVADRYGSEDPSQLPYVHTQEGS